MAGLEVMEECRMDDLTSCETVLNFCRTASDTCSESWGISNKEEQREGV